MSENTTFGSQFLEALDAASGWKNFNYAKRKALREMDRDAVLTQVGLADVANAAGLTAEEAVHLLKGGSTSGLSPEEGAALLDSTLLALNLMILSSD